MAASAEIVNVQAINHSNFMPVSTMPIVEMAENKEGGRRESFHEDDERNLPQIKLNVAHKVNDEMKANMPGPKRVLMGVDTKAIEPMFVSDKQTILAETNWSVEKYGSKWYQKKKRNLLRTEKELAESDPTKMLPIVGKVLKAALDRVVPPSITSTIKGIVSKLPKPKIKLTDLQVEEPPNPTLKHDDEYEPLGCCMSYKYQESAQPALQQKVTTAINYMDQTIPYEGGAIKVLESGHVIISEKKGLMTETKIIDVRCIEHIELLSAPEKPKYLINVCGAGCCGEFPELANRIILSASDRTVVKKYNCCGSWSELCCGSNTRVKQIIADIPAGYGNTGELINLISKIRELQKLADGNNGRCFQVLDIMDTQGRLFARGNVKVLSPEGCVELPNGAILVKDPAEILMMNEEKLIKFIETRGGTLLPENEMPYVIQAQRLYESQQCPRFAEEEMERPEEACCEGCCHAPSCCCSIPPLLHMAQPVIKSNRELYYTIHEM